MRARRATPETAGPHDARRALAFPTFERTRLGPTARTLILSGMGLLAGLGIVIAVEVTGAGPDVRARELTHRALPAELALQRASVVTVTAQARFLAALGTDDPQERASAMEDADNATRTGMEAWSDYRTHALNLPGEDGLRRSFEESSARARELGVHLVASARTVSDYGATLQNALVQFDEGQRALTGLEGLYRPLLLTHADSVYRGIVATRRSALVSYGVAIVSYAGLMLVLLNGARRDERLLRTEAAAMRAAAQRVELESALQRGLEMQSTEESTFGVVHQALETVAPGMATEMLLADSSHAHFRQVAASDPNGDEACGAPSPTECPVAATGKTHFFEDSTRLDACPLLRGRAPAVWAACVPVTVAGQTTGVIRIQQPADVEPRPELVANLELVARKAGDRIGVLRVLARTEAQARVDPLTGLPNRRILENQAREVLGEDGRLVVAFADLDRFKAINDNHGHDAGDRALRLFARVLRDSVRPGDLLARYGGEEFLVILPDCSTADALVVAERIRTHLAGAVSQATVPPFTVTIGLAAADPGELFFEVVARADSAMLEGKTRGGNCVVTADEAGRAGPFPPRITPEDEDHASPSA